MIILIAEHENSYLISRMSEKGAKNLSRLSGNDSYIERGGPCSTAKMNFVCYSKNFATPRPYDGKSGDNQKCISSEFFQKDVKIWISKFTRLSQSQ